MAWWERLGVEVLLASCLLSPPIHYVDIQGERPAQGWPQLTVPGQPPQGWAPGASRARWSWLN